LKKTQAACAKSDVEALAQITLEHEEDNRQTCHNMVSTFKQEFTQLNATTWTATSDNGCGGATTQMIWRRSKDEEWSYKQVTVYNAAVDDKMWCDQKWANTTQVQEYSIAAPFDRQLKCKYFGLIGF
jgi:hypothetical protein